MNLGFIRKKDELIAYLSVYLSLSFLKVENALRKALRWQFGSTNRRFYDTVGKRIFNTEQGYGGLKAYTTKGRYLVGF